MSFWQTAAHNLRAEQAKILARVLLENDEPLPARSRKLVGSRSAENDAGRLRGLPAVGRGVSGAVPGTDPLRALLVKESRRRRHE